MFKCKYSKTEISEINTCTIKKDLVDKEKIKLIMETELKLGCLGSGIHRKTCLFSDQKACPCYEE